MATGPVEYIVISFPGETVKSEIAPAIGKLVDQGTVHILDLVFIKKDRDGVVAPFEIGELDDAAAFVPIDGETGGLLGLDDIAEVAQALEPGSSALFIMWEDLWAGELAQVILAAGGEIRLGERLPRAAVEKALSEAGIDMEEDVRA